MDNNQLPNSQPPVIPTPSIHQSSYGSPVQDGPGAGGTRKPADKAFDALRRLPARDTRNSMFGGVAAGLARQLGIAPIAVRATLVVLAVFAGTGIGLYLLAWAVMPDERGQTHLEKALKHGSGGSVVLMIVGALVALGVVFAALEWVARLIPVLLGLAIIGGLGYWGYTALGRNKGTQG